MTKINKLSYEKLKATIISDDKDLSHLYEADLLLLDPEDEVITADMEKINQLDLDKAECIINGELQVKSLAVTAGGELIPISPYEVQLYANSSMSCYIDASKEMLWHSVLSLVDMQ